jgi:hypothetical protein
MKIPRVVALAELAISFALPTFAQQVSLDAAARAKAAAGREAHNHAPARAAWFTAWWSLSL